MRENTHLDMNVNVGCSWSRWPIFSCDMMKEKQPVRWKKLEGVEENDPGCESLQARGPHITTGLKHTDKAI